MKKAYDMTWSDKKNSRDVMERGMWDLFRRVRWL
jgi:hypothetical protein